MLLQFSLQRTFEQFDFVNELVLPCQESALGSEMLLSKFLPPLIEHMLQFQLMLRSELGDI